MEHINIIGTLYDNSIDHNVAYASQVYDDTLKKKQNVINSELCRDIESVQTDIQSLRNSINNTGIPQPSETVHFAFMTQSQYDELEEYDQDTLYFIIQGTGLGIFPITLT